ILFATLRLPDARPVARGLLVTCRSRGDTASCEVGTDAAGRMRCNLGAFGTSDDCVINIASYDRQEDNDISVELAPRKVDAGVNDLGELRLAAQGLLVAGRLVRDPGVRAEHVQIDFERRYGDQWQRQRANLYPDWQPDDSFSLCSEIPAGTAIRLVVQPGAYLPVDPIECKAGDRDVEIRLRAAGELTATFLVDDSTPVDRLVFRLRQRPPHPIDERVLDYMSRFGESPKDGRMPRWWRGLTPGTYDLTVACAGVAEPIASVAGMTVGTGPCTDPRLDAIDLRGRLRTFEVRATDAGGQPIADENAFVIVCSSREWSCYGLGNGRASIYATTSLDVVVTAPGCRATRVHGVAGSRTIALERDQPTAFRVAWPLPLPDGVTATLRLVPKVDLPHDERVVLDNDWGMPIWKLLEQFERRALVGRDGACSVPVVWPGEYTVEVSLATGERLVQLRDVAPTTVVLPAPGEIVLTIDRASCDAALQRVRK
ncbi:MAG TPA: hypothetical protein VFD82_15410, partial [Planctomycetota bacterium]|nr:hypothetical protein [Planctomycetota bacterium]